jgi:hypothetical protein
VPGEILDYAFVAMLCIRQTTVDWIYRS